MKYLRQFCIILLISALGEGVHILLPLPVPASVYGLVLMLGALTSGILKLEQVEDAADFLVEIMPVMFVPAGSASQIRNSLHRLLAALPDDTSVYPGHDTSTTIGYEKRYNPFV